MDEIRKTVGANIKKACHVKGIRQVDISEYMGVSQGTVSNWFKGINSIDIENLARLCVYIGVSLDQVFGITPMSYETTFSDEEKNILHLFRTLNKDGRAAAVSAVEGIANNPAFQQDAPSSSMA